MRNNKYDNPIKHFNDLAEERAIELGLNDDIEKTLEIDLRQFLDSNFKTNNLGYIFLKSIYKKLDVKYLIIPTKFLKLFYQHLCCKIPCVYNISSF